MNCGEPESPEHGYVMGQSFQFMDVVVVACDEGYTFSQNKYHMRCQADGAWEATNGICESMFLHG